MAVADALPELEALLGARLSRSKRELEGHGRSETHFPPAPPDAVAFPESTAEAQGIARICARHGCPVVGWGAGTSLEAHSLALSGGLCVDFRRMDRILRVSAEDMYAVVQPGATRGALERELRATGLFFPVDPGADASLGGMAMTRASGTTAVRYGTMRDNVMGLEVVLAGGRAIRTGTRARKSSSGYDLTGLMVGSEGTLGLVTELTLRLSGRPERTVAATCSFPGMGAAVEAVVAAVQAGVPMARIEFVDRNMARAFNAYAGASMAEAPHLMVEFHGTAESVEADAARFRELAGEAGAEGFARAEAEEDRRALWKMRHEAHYASMSLRPGARVLVTDICVPVSRLAEAVEETGEDIAAMPFPGTILGHVGDGNFHAEIMFDEEDPAEAAAARGFSERMAERGLRLDGTCTGEHGIGAGKLGFMEAEHGEAWDVMGEIKRALDPGNVMNPGKLVPPPGRAARG